MYKTDILIVGTGGAGARAAIEASLSGLDIFVVTKGRAGGSGATIVARADMDVDSRSAKERLGLPGDLGDTQETFFEDILREGKFINNQKMVEVLVEDAPLRIKELMDWGMRVFDLVKAAGHRFPRGIVSSGVEIMRALKNEIRRHSNIRFLEDVMVLDLLKTEDHISGAVGLNLRTGKIELFSAKAIIIATGGAQMIYPMCTAPEELTGDGVAAAWRAGADLVDMEMVQFLPATFIDPPAWKGVGFPFAISLNQHTMRGWLLNRRGERFMEKWDPVLMENSTRDKLSIAIMQEVIQGRGSPKGGVFLSFAHLPKDLIDYFPQWYGKPNLPDDWTYMGMKFKDLMERVKDGYAMEVAPACHFFMGGIRVDVDGRTSVNGLYSAGEASGGLHGANRLSGNAISQILVQGKRAGETAARYCTFTGDLKTGPLEEKEIEERYLFPLKRSQGISPFELRRKIHEISWRNAGPLRKRERLQEALDEIKRMEEGDVPRLACSVRDRVYNREWIESLQIKNLLLVLKAVVLSALERAESRGAHYREDYPEMNNREWLRNIVLVNDQGEMKVTRVPLVRTKYDLPTEGE
jgi:succinate dehydrogenase/fumarate reductase flavoprotein subunit